MCRLTDKINNQEYVWGYKIVLNRNGMYFSPTTGIAYEIGPVTIPTKQINIIDHIVNDLLIEGSFAHNKDMVGRTCVFLDYKSAKDIYEQWRYCSRLYNEHGTSLKIVRMALYSELMFGDYSNNILVVGGTHIYAIKEI